MAFIVSEFSRWFSIFLAAFIDQASSIALVSLSNAALSASFRDQLVFAFSMVFFNDS